MVRIVSLFKYLPKHHAEALVAEGNIRIGTLHGFRAQELGPARGDVDEGTSETTHSFAEAVDVARPENQSWVVQKMVKFGPNATNVTFENLTLSVSEKSPDCFVYCMSHQYSQRALSEFGADACVQILDPGGFVEALHTGLREQGFVTAARMQPCEYGGRWRSHEQERIHPAFVKDPKYRYQDEVRIVFEPSPDVLVKPFVTAIPALSQFCRLRPASSSSANRRA